MSRKMTDLIGLLVGVMLIVTAVFLKSSVASWYLLPLAIGILIVIVFFLRLVGIGFPAAREADRNEPRYERKKTILSRPEMSFYEILKELFADKFEVLPQVALLSVVDKLTHTGYRNELFRIIDFGLFDKHTFAPLVLIELNDSSHLRADRRERDEKVRKIADSAALPLVCFTMDEARDAKYVYRTINKSMLKK